MVNLVEPARGKSEGDLVTDNGGDWKESFRPDIPSPARMYDYYLGGKDHYPADREAAEQVLSAAPDIRLGARANREFLQRAVRFLAGEAGIRQFLDIGTGLPTAGNVHEVAQSVAPDSRIVYVDNDPVVKVHALDLLHGVDGTTFIKHDLREPDSILDDPELRRVIDTSKPTAVLLLAILHFLSDDERPREIVERLLGPFPSGSYLVLTHGTADSRPQVHAAAKVYDKATSRGFARSHDQVNLFLTGLEPVDPGLVWVPQWRPGPDTALTSEPERSIFYGAVARKP